MRPTNWIPSRPHPVFVVRAPDGTTVEVYAPERHPSAPPPRPRDVVTTTGVVVDLASRRPRAA